MEAKKDCLVRAISKDGFVNAVAVYTRGLTERARQIHHTSPVATAALGRALAACSMMGNALKDNGDGAGWCLYMVNDDGSVNFAQWCDVESASGSTGVLGQYPDPCKDADKANKAFSSTKISSWG